MGMPQMDERAFKKWRERQERIEAERKRIVARGGDGTADQERLIVDLQMAVEGE